jgi:GntP family gluconate:H+ symporter
VSYPLFFICADNILDSLLPAEKLATTSLFTQKIVTLIQLLGDKNIALVGGGLIALVMLASQKKGSKEGMTAFVQAALMSGGGIILITAAGGAFGGMIQQSGISARISEMTKDYQMALIPLAFVISAVVRTAQGSATVALITASGILSGMATSAHLDFHPLYLGLAIGCGSKLIPWMNDAGFWIIIKISNLTEREALKTFSPMLVVMGTVGLLVLLMAAKFFPLV